MNLTKRDISLIKNNEIFDPCEDCIHHYNCYDTCDRYRDFREFSDKLRERNIFILWKKYQRYIKLKTRIQSYQKELNKLKDFLITEGVLSRNEA